MRSRILYVLAGLMCSLALAGQANGQTAAPQSGPLLRVLFIGNSYTRFNDLAREVRRFAEAAEEGPRIESEAVANPGWTLTRHWGVESTRDLIRTGQFTHVVLQGHSLATLQREEEFEGVVGQFDELIRRSGARTVLFETWARRRGASVYRRRHQDYCAEDPLHMQAQITQCYSTLARARGALLAPVGRAWLAAQEVRDGRDLYRSDGHHPSLRGTYLASAVFYAVLTGRDPRHVPYRIFGVSRREAESLKTLAWQAVHPPSGS